jgi:flagellar hook-basal body complex protein FliE
MNIASIEALGAQDEVAPPAGGPTQAVAAAGPGFLQQVAEGLEQVNGQLMASQADLQRLAVGDTENLHAVMIRLEESRISLQLMLQVRNRVLEAYQDVMRMQV